MKTKPEDVSLCIIVGNRIVIERATRADGLLCAGEMHKLALHPVQIRSDQFEFLAPKRLELDGISEKKVSDIAFEEAIKTIVRKFRSEKLDSVIVDLEVFEHDSMPLKKMTKTQIEKRLGCRVEIVEE